MSFAADLRMYGRFARALPGLLNARLTLGQARAIVQQRLEQRGENFLRLTERSVFGYPRSPYLPLMHEAGCTIADLRHMVRTCGVETTLERLREAGVYVTFEEFKGREPIRRGRVTLDIRSGDFDNPFLTRHYYSETGGTSGPATRVPIDCEHLAASTPHLLLAYHAHGVSGVPTAVWRSILPDSSGIGNFLRGPSLGQVPEKWFTPVTRRDLHPSFKNLSATLAIRLIARHYGVRIPAPEAVPLDRALVVARWAAGRAAQRGAALVRSSVSLAVRIALAAREADLRLDGVVLMGGSEPPTEPKVRTIQASGARWIPMYAFTEAGRIGVGCAHPVDGNDLHFLKDTLALIQHPRQVKGTSLEVPAFYFTSLLPSSPKILINVENDDYGTVEHRRCGCPLEAFGLTEHVRHVRSARKLTGEGVTLVGSDMERILGEVLPARFGGGPLDYQLLEEEDHRGLTRLNLLVNPGIRIASDQAIVETILEELRKTSDAGDIAQVHWRQADTFVVKRAAPIWTSRGKLMPLHLADRGRPLGTKP